MTEPHYITIDRALRQLADNREEQPRLAELAADAGMSEFYFQRVFKEWVGISPKKFLQHLTLEAAKLRLRQSMNVLDTAYDVGLSSPGRLHDLFVTLEAMTPGNYRQRGQGLDIYYGFHHSPFGECLLATTEQGICGIGFSSEIGRDASLADFQNRWPAARFTRNPPRTGALVSAVFPQRAIEPGATVPRLSLVVPGTPFQVKVWQALLEVPTGHLVTYNYIAKKLGYKKTAARAVGQAVGANPVSWLIPCHRVIRETGAITGYHWGIPRKLAMIGWEATRFEAGASSQSLTESSQ
jgi:AraC family transcriptional regulator, regulatory protein of adaptative response / methylated-DNA-[protein]-cysteine methyltransferase